MTLADPAARLPKAFLAVSLAADAVHDPCGPGGELRVRAAAAILSDACPVTVGGGDTRVWLAGPGPEDSWAGPGAGFTVLLARLPRGVLGAAELGALLPDPGQGALVADPAATRAMSGLTPPFAVVCCAGPDRPVLAATDQLGYRHLYWCQGEGWAAMGTSSLALAYLAAARLDEEALAVHGQLGFHLGCATPFAGVRKLGPGGLCALVAGTARLGQYASPGPPSPPPPQAPSSQVLEGLARSTAGLLRDVGRGYLDQHPDLVLQLSGGLDSRIQLAAIPRPLRAGIRAVTLDEADSPDTVIARELAEGSGLKHEVLSLDSLADLGPAQAYQLVRRAAIRHDCSGDPITLAVLDWAEQRLDKGPGSTAWAGRSRAASTTRASGSSRPPDRRWWTGWPGGGC